jgi:chromosome partitioning protein
MADNKNVVVNPEVSIITESEFNELVGFDKLLINRYNSYMFTRPKKIVFCNNKGSVGKTTTLFNIASEMSKKGLRVVMVDLDPQCNLTMNVIGENRVEDLFNGEIKTIYDVLKGIESGISDIDINIKPYSISNNLFLIPGSLDLSSFEENVMNTAFNETTSGLERGFRITSSINRYLDKIALDYSIDLILVDTSPNLGVLNKVAILGSDFFIVPVNPDIFSVQGVKNIGKTFKRWRDSWKTIQVFSGKTLASELILKADPIFLGWIINDYSLYNEEIAKILQVYCNKLEEVIKDNLSTSMTKNGLFQITQKPIGQIQQFGTLMQRTHEVALAVVNMQDENLKNLAPGSKKTFKHVKIEIEQVTKDLIGLAEKYQNA